MGYVHSYSHTQKISEPDWDLCVNALSVIIRDAESRGVFVSVDAHYTPLSKHQMLHAVWHKDSYVHGSCLRFNGAGNQSCEPFVLWKDAAPIQPWQIQDGAHIDGFMSVKTQLQPYDTLVVAFLCWLTTRLPRTLDNIHSDGGEAEWEGGRALAQHLFPDLVIVNPMTLKLS